MTSLAVEEILYGCLPAGPSPTSKLWISDQLLASWAFRQVDGKFPESKQQRLKQRFDQFCNDDERNSISIFQVLTFELGRKKPGDLKFFRVGSRELHCASCNKSFSEPQPLVCLGPSRFCLSCFLPEGFDRVCAADAASRAWLLKQYHLQQGLNR